MGQKQLHSSDHHAWHLQVFSSLTHVGAVYHSPGESSLTSNSSCRQPDISKVRKVPHFNWVSWPHSNFRSCI